MNMVSINIPYNIKNIKDILKLSNTQLKNVIMILRILKKIYLNLTIKKYIDLSYLIV